MFGKFMKSKKTENVCPAKEKTFMEKFRPIFRKLVFLTIGSIIVAFGLESFLVPNEIIDGGIVGISIMASFLTQIPLGLFTFFLNVPFLILGFKHLGKKFVLLSLYSTAMLSIFVTIFHNLPRITSDMLLASIFGGIIVGIGVGIILRNNGALDGTEIVALVVGKKIPFSTGEIIMFINIFIFIAAAIVFTVNQAMYSVLTYFLIYKSIDVVLEGIDESRTVMIITNCPDEISNVILYELKRGVTFIDGKGAYSGEYKKILYCVVTRLEIAKLKEMVHEIDPKAFIAITSVHEVEGGQVKKKR